MVRNLKKRTKFIRKKKKIGSETQFVNQYVKRVRETGVLTTVAETVPRWLCKQAKLLHMGFE